MFRAAPIFVLGSQPQRRGFGRVSSGFNPDDYGITMLWLKAQGLPYGDGDLVDFVPNLLGAGSDAVASGTDRPAFRAGVINSKSAFEFSNAQGLRGSVDVTGKEMTAFSVWMLSSIDNGNSRALSTVATGSDFNDPSCAAVHLQRNGIATVGSYRNGDLNITGSSFDTWMIQSARWKDVGGTVSHTTWINGSSSSDAMSDADFNTLNYGLGCRYEEPGSDGRLTGLIAETLLWQSGLSDSDMLTVFAHLNDYYAIY